MHLHRLFHLLMDEYLSRYITPVGLQYMCMLIDVFAFCNLWFFTLRLSGDFVQKDVGEATENDAHTHTHTEENNVKNRKTHAQFKNFFL